MKMPKFGGGRGGGKTASQADAIIDALQAGQQVLLCRDGYAIRTRLEGGKIVYEEIEETTMFKPISTFDWLRWNT